MNSGPVGSTLAMMLLNAVKICFCDSGDRLKVAAIKLGLCVGALSSYQNFTPDSTPLHPDLRNDPLTPDLVLLNAAAEESVGVPCLALVP